MINFNWPNIFSSGRTNLVSDKEAIKQSLKLLIQTEKKTLFGDPGYGLYIRRFLYHQNYGYLSSLIREEIYEAILKYLPQVYLQKSDITFDVKHNILYVYIVYSYVEDNETDMFSIDLVQEQE